MNFFYSRIEAIWDPDKQAKMVSLKINFREDTVFVKSVTRRSVSLRGVLPGTILSLQALFALNEKLKNFKNICELLQHIAQHFLFAI